MTTDMRAGYEQVKGYIGRTERTSLGTVTRQHFQRYAYATGDLNPLYLDPEYARAAGYPDVIAPPVYLSGVVIWEAGPAAETLREDGLPDTGTTFIPLPDARVMGAGQDLEFVHPVQDGDEVTVERELMDVQFRQGKSGDFMVITTERRYTNQHGQLLLICRDNLIVR